MSALLIILTLKIVVTFFAVVAPFLAFPVQRLADLTKLPPQCAMLFRLYGIAVLALLICYAFGAQLVLTGTYPIWIVAMGVVSNTGAASILLMSGSSQINRGFSLFYGAVAVALAATFAAPNLSIAPLF